LHLSHTAIASEVIPVVSKKVGIPYLVYTEMLGAK